MKKLALLAIIFYQRFVSPYKGFVCAYRAHTGRAGCSALGYRSIKRFGVLRGITILRKRFDRCAAARRRHFQTPAIPLSQAGFCDLPCDIDCGLTACDVLTGCGPCDCGDWWLSRRKKDEERWVYIPPNVNGKGAPGKTGNSLAERSAARRPN